MDISTGSDTAMGISSGMEKLVVDSDDQAALAAIGKKSAFTRRFNFWTALAITVCISGTVSILPNNFNHLRYMGSLFDSGKESVLLCFKHCSLEGLSGSSMATFSPHWR